MAHMVASLHQSRNGNSSLEQLWLSLVCLERGYSMLQQVLHLVLHRIQDLTRASPNLQQGGKRITILFLLSLRRPLSLVFFYVAVKRLSGKGIPYTKTLVRLVRQKSVCINVSLNCFHVYLILLAPWRWLCFGARQEALVNWEARVFFGIKGAGNTELLGGKEGSKPKNK